MDGRGNALGERRVACDGTGPADKIALLAGHASPLRVTVGRSRCVPKTSAPVPLPDIRPCGYLGMRQGPEKLTKELESARS
jgi:hypothetical protein